MSFTVIQRKRMSLDERDLAEFFNPMNEAEAYSLALRLTGPTNYADAPNTTATVVVWTQGGPAAATTA